MNKSIILLMQAGIGVLGEMSSDYPIDVFNGAELKPSSGGDLVRIEGAELGNFIDIPLSAVGHLLATEPEIFLYSTDKRDGVATYLGSIILNRDMLIEANTWCKAYRQLGGEKGVDELNAVNS